MFKVFLPSSHILQILSQTPLSHLQRTLHRQVYQLQSLCRAQGYRRDLHRNQSQPFHSKNKGKIAKGHLTRKKGRIGKCSLEWNFSNITQHLLANHPLFNHLLSLARWSLVHCSTVLWDRQQNSSWSPYRRYKKDAKENGEDVRKRNLFIIELVKDKNLRKNGKGEAGTEVDSSWARISKEIV